VDYPVGVIIGDRHSFLYGLVRAFRYSHHSSQR
jgi:hypothetical protein